MKYYYQQQKVLERFFLKFALTAAVIVVGVTAVLSDELPAPAPEVAILLSDTGVLATDMSVNLVTQRLDAQSHLTTGVMNGQPVNLQTRIDGDIQITTGTVGEEVVLIAVPVPGEK